MMGAVSLISPQAPRQCVSEDFSKKCKQAACSMSVFGADGLPGTTRRVEWRGRWPVVSSQTPCNKPELAASFKNIRPKEYSSVMCYWRTAQLAHWGIHHEAHQGVTLRIDKHSLHSVLAWQPGILCFWQLKRPPWLMMKQLAQCGIRQLQKHESETCRACLWLTKVCDSPNMR